MSINWQDTITQLGGGAMVLATAGWLIRSLITSKLSKDVERFKADLNAKANTEIERLRSALQIAVIEHQVRFSNLHEKQAQVIADLYSLLVDLFAQSESFVHGSSLYPRPEHPQEYAQAVLRIREFVFFVDKHRAYLPMDVCALVDRVVDPLKRAVIAVGAYGNIGPTIDPQHMIQIGEKFTQAYAAFDTDIPAAQGALTQAFRTLLGVQRGREGAAEKGMPSVY